MDHGRKFRWGCRTVVTVVTLVASSATSIAVLGQSAGASPPALQACDAANVRFTMVHVGNARGRDLEAFKLENTGATTCGMEGYADVTFFTASRLDNRVKVVHDASAYAYVAPKLLVVSPGDVVSFGLSYRDTIMTQGGSTKDCLVQSVLVQLPLAATVSGDFATHFRFNACAAGNVVALTPVEPRALPKQASAY